MVNALVMAGSSGRSQLEESVGIENKSFIQVHNKPLIGYILEVLLQMPGVDQIGVVGPENELLALQKDYHFKIVLQRGDMMDNLVAGVEVFPEDERVLIISGDVPMITAEGLEDFLTRCGDMKSDFYYSIIPREECIKRFPGVERTYVKIRDGNFTGGNVFLVNPRVIPSVLPRVRELLNNRKNPVKMASLLGLGLLLGVVTKQLSIKHAEKRVGKILGISVKAVISPYAELGTDVDKISDLHLAERELA